MVNKNSLFLIFYIALCTMTCEIFDENALITPWGQHWQAPLEYDDSGAAKSLNVAAVSFMVNPSPDVNRNKMIEFIDIIKSEHPDIKLILFPETTLGYYYRSSDPSGYQKSIAETIPGVTTDIISLKAIEHQVFISFGITEKSGEDIFNSQVLISPDGNIISVHHKNYFIPLDKESGFKAGNDITINIIENIKVATVICHDIEGIDANKKIHNSGAELVLLPLASSNSFSLYIDDQLDRQYTNTWRLTANRVGSEDGIKYNGSLKLSSPGGETKVKMSGKEGYIYGVVKCW